MRKLASLVVALFATFGLVLNAQEEEAMTPEEQAKKMQEYIDDQIQKLETSLKLEDWQVYYVDSILNNDYRSMNGEIERLSASKVTNTDLYTVVSDKWNEQIYNSLHKVFNDEQWKKYLKAGAAKEKKARDKRAEKRGKQI